MLVLNDARVVDTWDSGLATFTAHAGEIVWFSFHNCVVNLCRAVYVCKFEIPLALLWLNLKRIRARFAFLIPALFPCLTSGGLEGGAMSNSKPQVWSKMSSEEIRLANMWFHDDGKAPSAIAELLHRDKSTLSRLLVLTRERKTDGHPRAFTEDQIGRIIQKLEEMVLKANKEWRVTADMVKTAMRIKASTKRVLEAFHSRDIFPAKPREAIPHRRRCG